MSSWGLHQDPADQVHQLPASEVAQYRISAPSSDSYGGDEGFDWRWLRDDISRNGVQNPVTIYTDGTRAHLDDGNHRATLAHEMEVPHVPAHIVRLTPEEYDGYADDHQGLPGGSRVAGPSLRAILSPHTTASTDGIRYAHIVEADVAEDLRKLASHDPDEETRLAQEAARNEVEFHSTRHQDDSPYGQAKNRLYDEFMSWWPKSQAAQERSPDTSNTNWRHYPHEPIVHWPNVESFLEENYPDSATRSVLGKEEAQGWEGTPVTRALLGLHNAIQGRTSLADENEYDFYRLQRGQQRNARLHNKAHPFRGELAAVDQQRLVDIAQKRMQMQRDYENRTRTAMPAPLPKGTTFHYHTDDTDVPRLNYYRPINPTFDVAPEWEADPTDWVHPGHPGYHPKELAGFTTPAVEARVNGKHAGYLSWHPESNHVTQIQVFNPYTRQSIATSMWDHAKQINPALRHSSDRTPLGRQWVEHEESRHRTAMPAPLPKGVYFRYHPELMWSPGVTAHAPGGKQIGSLEWYDDDHVMVDLGTRRPGEIDRISVHPDHQGHSVATSMFDFAKQYEPRLHHSDQLTEDGRGWSEYEKARNARLGYRFDSPDHIAVTRHPGHDGESLAQEVWDQDGPKVLWSALRNASPDEHIYVARDPFGTIHGVGRAEFETDHEGAPFDSFDSYSNYLRVNHLYTSLKAPPGTGNKIMQDAARHGIETGHHLMVNGAMPHTTDYYNRLGVDEWSGDRRQDGYWSDASQHALVAGDSIPGHHTPERTDHDLYTPVPRAKRLPGSARLAMAWDEFSDQITPATAAGGPVKPGESCENCPQPNYPDGFKYVQRPGSDDRWNYSGGKQMRYRIKHPDNSESYLAYGHYLDGDSKPYLGINMISTDPNHQHRGVAESLIRKLHEDHPGVPIDPGGMTDAGKAFKNRLEERIPEASDMLRRRARLAAVTQDLVDRLHDEFHQWVDNGGDEIEGVLHDFGEGRGPLGNWMNIENFMREKYPAAHRGLESGQEEAQPLMDQQTGVYGDPVPKGYDPYETGPEAEARHGYDPKEIAAGMLLLHNKTHKLRDLGQLDTDRLNDIAQKRMQMQRDYENRTRTAMPAPLPKGTTFHCVLPRHSLEGVGESPVTVNWE